MALIELRRNVFVKVIFLFQPDSFPGDNALLDSSKFFTGTVSYLGEGPIVFRPPRVVGVGV